MLLNITPVFPGSGQFKVHNTRVIAQALSRIAGRSPTPELREVLPDLQEIAGDSVLQDKRSRAAARGAARKIRVLTAKLDALPVTAAAPEASGASRPRAAAAPNART